MITTILIIINILVFILTYNNPLLMSQVLSYGLNNYNMYNPLIWVTSMFLHANMTHIAMNMIALLQLGLLIEKEISKKILLNLYFLSGLGSAIASIIYLSNGNEANVIGASGAIFGLFAFYSIVTNRINSFLIQVVLFHTAILFFQLPVAWYAHFGGILVGSVFAIFYKRKVI